jgi:hypothetical protein
MQNIFMKRSCSLTEIICPDKPETDPDMYILTEKSENREPCPDEYRDLNLEHL